MLHRARRVAASLLYSSEVAILQQHNAPAPFATRRSYLPTRMHFIPDYPRYTDLEHAGSDLRTGSRGVAVNIRVVSDLARSLALELHVGERPLLLLLLLEP
eukprot:1601122-Rhodomonas_salina.2